MACIAKSGWNCESHPAALTGCSGSLKGIDNMEDSPKLDPCWLPTEPAPPNKGDWRGEPKSGSEMSTSITPSFSLTESLSCESYVFGRSGIGRAAEAGTPLDELIG